MKSRLQCVLQNIFFVSLVLATDESIAQKASLIMNPEVAIALELLKSSYSSTTTQIIERACFDKINNVFDHSKGDVMKDNLVNLIEFWMSIDQFVLIPEPNRKTLANSIVEYKMTTMRSTYVKRRFEISFNDGVGHMFMLLITLNADVNRKNVIIWEKLVLVSEFIPSKPYTIVTESDCNLLGCDRTDTIVYLPAVVTNDHINTIITMNMNAFSGLYAQKAIT